MFPQNVFWTVAFMCSFSENLKEFLQDHVQRSLCTLTEVLIRQDSPLNDPNTDSIDANNPVSQLPHVSHSNRSLGLVYMLLYCMICPLRQSSLDP